MKKESTIYTRTGDSGRTRLPGGREVGKDHALIEALGAVDDLNAQIGWAVSLCEDEQRATLLRAVQADLLSIGAGVWREPHAGGQSAH